MKKIISDIFYYIFSFFYSLSSNIFAPPQATVMKLINSYTQTQVITTAIELGIIDALKNKECQLEELADTLGIVNREYLFRFLRALFCLKIVSLKKGYYSLTRLGMYFESGNTRGIKYMTLSNSHIWYNCVSKLRDTVKEGSLQLFPEYNHDFYTYIKGKKKIEDYFYASMDEGTFQNSFDFIENYHFKPNTHIIDVGGGLGRLLIELKAKNKTLKCTLFELPTIIEKARSVVDDTINLVEGDFFESVPSDGDVYLLKNILHNWGDKEAVKILTNIRNVVPVGKKLILLEFMILHNEKRFAPVHLDLLMMTVTGGKERSHHEFSDLLLEAGFKIVKIKRYKPVYAIEAVSI